MPQNRRRLSENRFSVLQEKDIEKKISEVNRQRERDHESMIRGNASYRAFTAFMISECADIIKIMRPLSIAKKMDYIDIYCAIPYIYALTFDIVTTSTHFFRLKGINSDKLMFCCLGESARLIHLVLKHVMDKNTLLLHVSNARDYDDTGDRPRKREFSLALQESLKAKLNKVATDNLGLVYIDYSEHGNSLEYFLKNTGFLGHQINQNAYFALLHNGEIGKKLQARITQNREKIITIKPTSPKSRECLQHLAYLKYKEGFPLLRKYPKAQTVIDTWVKKEKYEGTRKPVEGAIEIHKTLVSFLKIIQTICFKFGYSQNRINLIINYLPTETIISSERHLIINETIKSLIELLKKLTDERMIEVFESLINTIRDDLGVSIGSYKQVEEFDSYDEPKQIKIASDLKQRLLFKLNQLQSETLTLNYLSALDFLLKIRCINKYINDNQPL